MGAVLAHATYVGANISQLAAIGPLLPKMGRCLSAIFRTGGRSAHKLRYRRGRRWGKSAERHPRGNNAADAYGCEDAHRRAVQGIETLQPGEEAEVLSLRHATIEGIRMTIVGFFGNVASHSQC